MPTSRTRPGVGAAEILVVVIVACAVLAAVSISQKAIFLAYRDEPIPWRGITLARLVEWYSYGLLVPFFYALARRFPLGAVGWRRTAPLYVGACLVAAALKIALCSAAGNYFRPGVFPVGDLLAEDLFLEAIAFLAIAGLVHAHLFLPFRRQGEIAPRPAPEPIDRFTVREGAGYRMVPVEAIERIDAQGNYVRLHAAGARHLLRDTMSSVEARLDPAHFVRVHRGLIVNIAHLRHIEPQSHGQYRLTLASGEAVRTGRRYNERVRRLIG